MPTFFIYVVKFRGETLGQITEWYTGSYDNWRKIARVEAICRYRTMVEDRQGSEDPDRAPRATGSASRAEAKARHEPATSGKRSRPPSEKLPSAPQEAPNPRRHPRSLR